MLNNAEITAREMGERGCLVCDGPAQGHKYCSDECEAEAEERLAQALLEDAIERAALHAEVRR